MFADLGEAMAPPTYFPAVSSSDRRQHKTYVFCVGQYEKKGEEYKTTNIYCQNNVSRKASVHISIQSKQPEESYLAMLASLDRSKRWAASTADTMAPSKADRSTTSSVMRNFRARLKKAAGPLDALTAMTCLDDIEV